MISIILVLITAIALNYQAEGDKLLSRYDQPRRWNGFEPRDFLPIPGSNARLFLILSDNLLGQKQTFYSFQDF